MYVLTIYFNISLRSVYGVASCFTDPLRKASFKAEAGLKLFPLQILKETLHLRLELV